LTGCTQLYYRIQYLRGLVDFKPFALRIAVPSWGMTDIFSFSFRRTTMRFSRGIVGVLAAAMAIAVTSLASGATVYYSGADPGVGFGGARPNSDAAAAAFAAATPGSSTITFEGATLGFFSTRTVASGVSMTTNNLDSTYTGISNDNASADNYLGFDTTVGGSQFFRFSNVFNTAGSVDFNFATPIDSFGAYLTGLESSVGGSVRVQYTDGTSQDIALTKAASSGTSVQFWGFVDAGASINKITFYEDSTNASGTRDIFGIDDVHYRTAAVPLPAAVWGGMALLSTLAGARSIRRRVAR
jgi:hypothetical protein